MTEACSCSRTVIRDWTEPAAVPTAGCGAFWPPALWPSESARCWPQLPLQNWGIKLKNPRGFQRHNQSLTSPAAGPEQIEDLIFLRQTECFCMISLAANSAAGGWAFKVLLSLAELGWLWGNISLGHQWASGRAEALWFWVFKALTTQIMGNWYYNGSLVRIKRDKKIWLMGQDWETLHGFVFISHADRMINL